MIALDARRLTDALSKLTGVCDDLGAIARTTELEALGHAVLGVRRNVYDTAPGAYRRTQDLLRGMQVSSRTSTNRASVTVKNTEPYALYVELGQQGFTLAQDQARSAAASDPAQPLSLGRSGQNPSVAGPFIGPAQFYALYRLGQLFGQKVKGQM